MNTKGREYCQFQWVEYCVFLPRFVARVGVILAGWLSLLPQVAVLGWPMSAGGVPCQNGEDMAGGVIPCMSRFP